MLNTGDLRAMTVDQLDDELLKLKKEQFNLRFQRATGQLENTSRVREVRRDIARIKTVAQQKRAAQPKSKQGDQDAEAPAPGHGGERQAEQDGRGARRPPLHPPRAEEDCAQVEEVLRARREERVFGRRPRVDRGAPADFQAQALDRGPGREEAETDVSATRERERTGIAS